MTRTTRRNLDAIRTHRPSPAGHAGTGDHGARRRNQASWYSTGRRDRSDDSLLCRLAATATRSDLCCKAAAQQTLRRALPVRKRDPPSRRLAGWAKGNELVASSATPVDNCRCEQAMCGRPKWAHRTSSTLLGSWSSVQRSIDTDDQVPETVALGRVIRQPRTASSWFSSVTIPLRIPFRPVEPSNRPATAHNRLPSRLPGPP